MPSVSIIICTANRAAELAPTLASMRGLDIPAGFDVELRVVDNAPSAATRAAAESAALPFPVRYVPEPRRGKGHAYNTALWTAAGDILLFTDDDVRVPANWVTGMCRPILEGRAHAVAGGIGIAPHLLRDWMNADHRSWLASTDALDRNAPPEMVGANMAFARSVRDKVPAFDVELGPGALGAAEESLFAWQLREAGYTIAAAWDAQVEHHFDPSRLTRKSFRNSTEYRGRSAAYADYHWHHRDQASLGKQRLRARLRLAWWRTKMLADWMRHPVMPGWEMWQILHIAYLDQWAIESRRPRNYDRHGLTKLRGTLPQLPAPQTAGAP